MATFWTGFCLTTRRLKGRRTVANTSQSAVDTEVLSLAVTHYKAFDSSSFPYYPAARQRANKAVLEATQDAAIESGVSHEVTGELQRNRTRPYSSNPRTPLGHSRTAIQTTYTLEFGVLGLTSPSPSCLTRQSANSKQFVSMRIVAPPPPSQGLRFSESAIPEHFDPAFQLPPSANRSSLAALDKPTGFNDPFGLRDSYTSEASGFDVLNFWAVETDHDASTSQLLTPTDYTDPYQGVTIEVNNHSINNQGVVMYHVDIKGPDGILSTYTIRRRFRAFKNLHSELSRLLLEYQDSRAQLDAAVAATASTPLDGPENHIPLSPHSAAALAKAPPMSNTNYRTVTFPSLPSAGVWSYLKRHDVRLVEQRKKRFQEILRLAIRHPATKHSSVLDEFLSVAPSEISQRGSSYVSLQDYSVPVFDRQRESIERRQRKMRVLEDRRLRAGSDSQFGERAHQ